MKRGGAIQDGVKASVWKRVVCTLVETRESIGLPVVHEKKCGTVLEHYLQRVRRVPKKK